MSMTERHVTCPSASAARPAHGIAAGVADFTAIRRDDSYYVDKTRHLAALLEDNAGPLLITRPRRFGKTLTLDTLRCFLELNYRDPPDTACQRQLFCGLDIMEDPALQECRDRHMGQHPVLAISFNTVEGHTYEEALQILAEQIGGLCASLSDYLQSADRLPERDLRYLERCLALDEVQDPSELGTLLVTVLPRLCQMLYRVYSRSVYVLIDEYDTPLARAWSAQLQAPADQEPGGGYYERMAALMRGLIHPLLKPQPFMQGSIARCILTGCTRVSRESLFSGANNLIVRGMDHLPTADLMGFTEGEVRSMLEYYNLSEHMAEVEEWYDGYRFAGVRIYNPWSIAHYCRDVLDTPGTQAGSYWAHAGRNDELSACLQTLPEDGLEQLRQLYEGRCLTLPLRAAFSYDELLREPGQEELFTLLCHTGYITEDDDGTLEHGRDEHVMRLPNAEVRECFEKQILGLYNFRQTARAVPSRQLLQALLRGDAPAAEQHLNWLLQRFLSFHMLGPRSRHREEIRRLIASLHHPRLEQLFRHVSTDLPERVYHLLVFGLLCGMADGRLSHLDMDREFGAGRPDISFIGAASPAVPAAGCILEFKAASSTADQDLCRAADAGLKQILDRDYARGVYAVSPGLQRIWAYGLGCQGKCCAVAGILIPPA